MNNEVITIPKYYLQNLEEKVAETRVHFATHSAKEIERAEERFNEQLQVLKAENGQLNQTNINLSENNNVLKLRNAELERQNDYMYQRLKERANADRGIPNKKTSHGYVVESCRQVIEQFKDNYDVFHTSTVWKTSFQTPLEAGLTFDIVHDAVNKDLGSRDLSNEFRFFYQPSDSFMDVMEDPSNVLFRVQFICDRRHGYWYIDTWSTGYIAPSRN